MKKYLVEFIGTFFLIFTIGMAVNFAGDMAAIAIGSVLMVMIYAGGHISGAHYNPAVTTAIYVRGSIELMDALMYMLFQLLGAVVAATVVWMLVGRPLVVAPGAGYSAIKVLTAETLGTFALAYVVLNVATHPKTSGNSYYGMAIGFTVTAMAFALGMVSGGAFNPAVGIGPNIIQVALGDTGNLHNVWLYIVGPVAGGVLAGLVYKFINAE